MLIYVTHQRPYLKLEPWGEAIPNKNYQSAELEIPWWQRLLNPVETENCMKQQRGQLQAGALPPAPGNQNPPVFGKVDTNGTTFSQVNNAILNPTIWGRLDIYVCREQYQALASLQTCMPGTLLASSVAPVSQLQIPCLLVHALGTFMPRKQMGIENIAWWLPQWLLLWELFEISKNHCRSRVTAAVVNIHSHYHNGLEIRGCVFSYQLHYFPSCNISLVVN